MGHLVYHGPQYFMPSTINHYIPITSENRQTAQAFTLAQSIQINLKTDPVQIIPKVQSMKINQKRIM